MSDQPRTDSPIAFGPNEWLVDELYEQFLNDRNSVDRAWWDFFADYRPLDATGAPTGDGGNGRGDSDRRSPSTCRRRRTSPGIVLGAAGPRQCRCRQERREHGRRRPGRDGADGAADTEADARSGRPAGPCGCPAPAPAEDRTTPLRGPAARVVANMQTSLAVPTATSVAYGAPGNCSSTTGWSSTATCPAPAAARCRSRTSSGTRWSRRCRMPEMNNAFGEQDGKPVVLRPAHVNLGLAIDLQKPDGSRSAARAEHQGCRDPRLRAVLDGIRGHGQEGPKRTSSPSRTSPARR